MTSMPCKIAVSFLIFVIGFFSLESKAGNMYYTGTFDQPQVLFRNATEFALRRVEVNMPSFGGQQALYILTITKALIPMKTVIFNEPQSHPSFMDYFEAHAVNPGTPFFKAIMKELGPQKLLFANYQGEAELKLTVAPVKGRYISDGPQDLAKAKLTEVEYEYVGVGNFGGSMESVHSVSLRKTIVGLMCTDVL